MTPSETALLTRIHDFLEEEADNRASAGSEMSDYEREARELADELGALLATHGPQVKAGQTVECVDAWDTFHNLTLGKIYEVVEARDGMIFVRGNAGHVGGWWASHFQAVEERA
jgi:hypothetical protein